MDRVGVFYATREGQARKVAERIVGVLVARGLEAALHDVADAAAADVLALSGAAVLVGSVHLGKHEPELVRFARAHRERLDAIPSAFVSVCNAEAAVEDMANTPAARVQAAHHVGEQLHAFFAATGWHPAHVRPVAGALVYTHYNPLVRWVLRRIAKSEGLPTDTSRDHELTDWMSVEDFAERLATELHGPTAQYPDAR